MTQANFDYRPLAVFVNPPDDQGSGGHGLNSWIIQQWMFANRTANPINVRRAIALQPAISL
ncbi:MAG: hypothetical protein CL610_30405 [Anaerolineaceae bacterium]|nr:hypothetical protein [Anaerolineaceae bacterium]